MKKEYLNPQIHVVKIQTMSVLAESLKQSKDSASTIDGEYSNSLAGEFFDGGESEDW